MLVSAMHDASCPECRAHALYPLDARPIARAACASGTSLSAGRRGFPPLQLIVASSESTTRDRAVRAIAVPDGFRWRKKTEEYAGIIRE
jgi:hypothetical protein